MRFNKNSTDYQSNAPVFVLSSFIFISILEGFHFSISQDIALWWFHAVAIVAVTGAAAVISVCLRKKTENSFESLKGAIEKLQVENDHIVKRMEEELEDKAALEGVLHNIKKELQDAFDAVDDWICVIDLNSTIRRTNQSVEKYYGLSAKKAIGKKCCKLVHHTDAPIDSCPLTEMLKTRKRASAEIQLNDGSWMNITVDPLFDENNEMIGAIHVAHDITGKVLIQKEREQLFKDLKESLNHVRTLSGLLPICSICKKIRDDKGYWKQIENYIHNHTGVDFSHSICPDCLKKHYPEYVDG